ncbi:MAG TPA: HAMP domain-containing sensor histidine kinase, partial [Chroococcales cyanobacterium]
GKPLAELALSEESGWLAQKFEQARLQELPRFETKLVRHDGKPVDVSFSVRWSADRRSFTCVIHDISSVKNAERLRQEVMQMVSHDLKSPLFTVSSFLEMYQESMIGSPSEAGKHRIQEAFSGCSQMLALIGNLLDMEKLNAGMLDLQKESLSLDACLEEARQAVGEELAARDIVIDWRPSAQALTVTGDRERLLQVFTGIFKQLLENPDAGQRITILAERLTAAQVEIRFLTNGSAVLPARQFASQLAIDVMRALVELHGGSLIVAGQRSAGADSLYTLRLPAAR